ncbi:MAG TPA: hypothetical protein PL068_09185 [Petrotogaceae bacterium]|jgi:hypothetical protein|nr:hypothetical protein [Petrotogaceae bacterium]
MTSSGDLIELHKHLNFLFSISEDTFKIIASKQNRVSYGNYSGHYTKIDGRYEYQKYPIPVITVADKGDIGFDLFCVWFEFFVDPLSLRYERITKISSLYRTEVYTQDCAKDIKLSNNPREFGETMASIMDRKIGISVYIDYSAPESIVHVFSFICEILEI